MKEPSIPDSRLTHQQRLELELMHSVLEEQATTYPWNPYDPAAKAYLDQLEDSFADDDLSEDVFNSQWHQVAQVAQQIWDAPAASLLTVLTQKFGSRMPANLLEQLATNAQTAAQSGRALIDQLVATAQAVLEDWEADDLQVMARPLALAMRSGGQGEVLETTLHSIRETDWNQLTEVEKARLSLAIARYALGEIAAEDA